MKVRCNRTEVCKKMFPERDCGAWEPHDHSQCEPCPFSKPGNAKCEPDLPDPHEMDFGEWIAELIACGMNNQEILTYLDTSTREEDLVALVRTLMTRREEKDREEPYDSFGETQEHRFRVHDLMREVAERIEKRGADHDLSKLEPPEKGILDEFTPKLRAMTYPSPEYAECLQAMLDAGFKRHYTKNRHHPEHFEAGVNSMNLIDLIEMLADWKAAGERHADGGNLYRSIKANEERFGMSGWLVDCLLHTAEDLGWWDGVIPED